MAQRQMTAVLGYLRSVLTTPAADSDRQLLHRFVSTRDQDAFAALVRRHGPLVWGVCRRVLRNEADTEDAFQATFLVMHLPDRYRMPMLLCCLQDQTIDEAARQLGWSGASVKGRLQRGRELLRARLQRRGIGLSAGALGTIQLQGTAQAVPPALLTSTMHAAAVETATASVAALVKGAMQAMLWTKIKMGALVVAFVAVAGLGVGTVLVRHPEAIAVTPVPEEARQPKKVEPKASEPVVKDGLEVVVKPTKAVFAANEMPSFEIIYKNVSEKEIFLPDVPAPYNFWTYHIENALDKKTYTANCILPMGYVAKAKPVGPIATGATLTHGKRITPSLNQQLREGVFQET